MMKSIALGTVLVLAAAGSAIAAPKYHGSRDDGFRGRGHITAWERVQIARSAAHVSQVKRWAFGDGRLTIAERFQIRRAEARHAALVSRARRT